MSDNTEVINNHNLAKELLIRGIYEFQVKNYVNALKHIDLAIKNKPNYYEALMARACLIYPLFDNYRGIIQDLTQVIESKPGYEAYNNRGYAFACIDEHLKAIRDYNDALIIDGNSVETYLNRGISYAHVEEYDRAIDDFNLAIKLDPRNADAFNNRGFVYSSLKEHYRAIADFDVALKLNPNHIRAYLNRGVSRLGIEDIFGGVQDFDIALEMDSQIAEEYFHHFEQALIDIQSHTNSNKVYNE